MQTSGKAVSAPGTTAFDLPAERARLRAAVRGAAMELGLAENEAARCAEIATIEIDAVAVSLMSVRALLDEGTAPDPLGPDWMLTARALELPDDQPLRSTMACTLLMHLGMASFFASGCVLGHDGEEGVHVMRATSRKVSPKALATQMQRVATIARSARALPGQLDALAADAMAGAQAGPETA